jgi:PAS domain S-box-containing protein
VIERRYSQAPVGLESGESQQNAEPPPFGLAFTVLVKDKGKIRRREVPFGLLEHRYLLLYNYVGNYIMGDQDQNRELLLSELELLRDRVAFLETLNATRYEVERALLENEELYRAVVESVADAIAITVKTERVFVNRAFLAIHGLRDASEVVGHPLDQFIFPEDREGVTERVLARQRGEPLNDLVEYRIQRPDGEIRTVQASVVTTVYKGQPATLAVLRDITAIKHAEMEIMRLNGELKQRVLDLRNANDELEAFNSTVSHDLRTPLMVIRGFSERIMKKYSEALDEKFGDQMGIIQTSAQKMEQLIDDLLAYSRLGKQALQFAPVPMNQLVESIVEELRTIYPGGEITICPLAPCVGDERMVRQVFTNLLSNAFKFSSHRTERMIKIGCFEKGNENVYFVKDNGAGFDMQHKDKLFNVFQRLHSQEEFGGTGMGLAIVKRIVSLHGGTVWGEGKPDGGATFYVTLPGVGGIQAS